MEHADGDAGTSTCRQQLLMKQVVQRWGLCKTVFVAGVKHMSMRNPLQGMTLISYQH